MGACFVAAIRLVLVLFGLLGGSAFIVMMLKILVAHHASELCSPQGAEKYAVKDFWGQRKDLEKYGKPMLFSQKHCITADKNRCTFSMKEKVREQHSRYRMKRKSTIARRSTSTCLRRKHDRDALMSWAWHHCHAVSSFFAFREKMMMLVTRVVMILLAAVIVVVKSRIYLHNTNDGQGIEYYDCVFVSPFFYCRRPNEPIDLIRENDSSACERNGGQVHTFSELRSTNTNISLILHQWKSSIERVERYSRYLRNSSELDGYLCECIRSSTFGKNCEYRIPMGETLQETLHWQLVTNKNDSWSVQLNGEILCYQSLSCDSGLLCLDWREICDGVQQCMSGVDEGDCEILEMNICHDNEYRCMNGMCIPDQYFLDGEFDCLDWSDELQFKEDKNCTDEAASVTCDDRMCPPHQWSCGDGQCIDDRFAVQKPTRSGTCQSRRDSFFLCETHHTQIMWTMNNGRCFDEKEKYNASLGENRTKAEQCDYLLRCALSEGGERGCPCSKEVSCTTIFEEACPSTSIQYPKGAIGAPYLFFFYNSTRHWTRFLPDVVLINGTIRCRGRLISVTRWISVGADLSERQLTKNEFCRPSADSSVIDRWCSDWNSSIDLCDEWNPCLSASRMKDGWNNCLDGRDEINRTEIEQSCALVQRHRFRCSPEQPSCLSVVVLGNWWNDCPNQFDELWLGSHRHLAGMNCNGRWKDECSLLRRYMSHSSIGETKELSIDSKVGLPFRFYCNTFWNTGSREDENITECQQGWICRPDQWQCRTGQCIDRSWVSDTEWDCDDASDEFDLFRCLPPRTSERRWIELNRTELGDHHIDCLGAIDERNTLKHCSVSSMLGYHFLCPSTNSCLPFWLHCRQGHRCPASIDDERWCQRENKSLGCEHVLDFVCFNGTCIEDGRCNEQVECLEGEDEYMCDYLSSRKEKLSRYREEKQTLARTAERSLHLIPFPLSVTVSTKKSNSSSSNPSVSKNVSISLSSSCNRGLSLLSSNGSLICLCSPHYYGEKCQYHTDRLLILLHLNLSRSIYTVQSNPTIVLKLLVLLLFGNQTLTTHEFHVRPALEIDEFKKKLVHLSYSRSKDFRDRRKNRSRNASDLYSLRIEAYRTNEDEGLSLLTVWQYPLLFSHLPVDRFAQVLHLRRLPKNWNPCSSDPCQNEHEECRQLMNNPSEYLCLCRANFTGENCSIEDPECLAGSCSSQSLCKPNYRVLLRGNALPYCICPLDRFGPRCDVEHEFCHRTPCQNGASCFPASEPDRVACICQKDFYGPFCQWKKPHLRLSLMAKNDRSVGSVVQYFEIDFASLDLRLVHQQVFATLPPAIEYFHHGERFPSIVLAKLYSRDEEFFSEMYLLSVYVNVLSIEGTTEISASNRCPNVHSLGQESLPMRYHRICANNSDLLCFRDDLYLCICADNHTRVECFRYDDTLDRCSSCVAGSRCLQGDRTRVNDYLCLCSPCHSGRRCQFNSKSFTFTLDQLFHTDLISSHKRTMISLLILFSSIGFLVALPNNFFSFVTLNRRSSLLTGIGHYLRCLSIVNQMSLTLLAARLIHLTLTTTSLLKFRPTTDDVLCKILNYSLTCFSRIAGWLSSIVAVERLYTVIFLRKQWLKQPHIARRLILVIFGVIFLSTAYEIVLIKSFSSIDEGTGTICVIEFPIQHRSLWISTHQIITIVNLLLPLLINVCSTITIIRIVIRAKVNLRMPIESTAKETPDRRILFRDVFYEHKEMIGRPAITLVPSIFSFFSLPLFIVAFSLECQNLEHTPLRYLLIIFYFMTYIPPMFTFILYIYPSSFYWHEWQETFISKRIAALRQRPSPNNSTVPSVDRNHKLKG